VFRARLVADHLHLHLFGAPEFSDVCSLLETLSTMPLHHARTRCIDAASLKTSTISSAAFDLLFDVFSRPFPALQHEALIVNHDVAGALLSGMRQLAPANHEWRLFRSSLEAFRWLRVPREVMPLFA